jgi:hypothetical protein
MPPIVAPAARKPNSRLPCPESKTSTMKDQNTETTKRLNTEVQMKKARPIQTCWSGGASISSSMKTSRFSMKKR